ncbi:MAG TPA: ABC transporter permease [Ilumatobacteraceae bacterium]|nr:ABC transporter permease [Ilumatobacteraceae bacterium]
MAGVALVFAMGVVMSGLAASFSREIERTLDAVGAETWAVSDQASGPFTSFTPVPIEAGQGAAPVMVLRQTIRVDGTVEDIVVLGVDPTRLGAPDPDDGAALSGRGQVVVDEALEGVGIGDSISVGGLPLDIVGTTTGQRIFAGIPVVYISLEDAQQIGVKGQPYATAFLYDETPTTAPEGLRLMSNHDVKEDALRPLENALTSIKIMQLLLWVVAATIIGSVLYLQALERTRDFAVFKATGTSTAAIGAGLALQAVVLSLMSAVVAAGLSLVLAPLVPMNIEIPASAFYLLPVVTVTVGLLASLVALRRTATVEPALAFGG